MVKGYPSDATDAAVQADVAAAGYRAGTTPFTPGATVSLQATTSCCTSEFLRHDTAAKFIRHHASAGYLASNGGANAWDTTSLWREDTSRLAASPWS